MKVSHDYFKNYNTRRIDFKQPTGLFVVNGNPVSREVLVEDSIKEGNIQREVLRTLDGSQQLVFSPGRGGISPLRKHLREHPQTHFNQSQASRSFSPLPARPSTTSDTSCLRRSLSKRSDILGFGLDELKLVEARQKGMPLHEILAVQRVRTPKEYTNRLHTPKHEAVRAHEDLMRAARAEFHTHIYHDNNFVRQRDDQCGVLAAERLWNIREKRIKDLQRSWTAEVTTPTPSNKEVLGLTPLRNTVAAQDKAHHIPRSHHTLRMQTKPTTPTTGRGNVWTLDVDHQHH